MIFGGKASFCKSYALILYNYCNGHKDQVSLYQWNNLDISLLLSKSRTLLEKCACKVLCLSRCSKENCMFQNRVNLLEILPSLQVNVAKIFSLVIIIHTSTPHRSWGNLWSQIKYWKVIENGQASTKIAFSEGQPYET